MPKDGLTIRPWYAWSPRDFYADPAVAAMEREERWRYRDALDAAWLWADPAIGSEDDWREAMDYSTEEWPAHRRRVARAMKVLEDGRWMQKRLRDEYEEWLRRVEQSREAGRARQRAASDRSAPGERPLSDRSADAQRPLSVGSGRAIDNRQQTGTTGSSASQKNTPGGVRHFVMDVAEKLGAREASPARRVVSPRHVWSHVKALPPAFRDEAVKLVGFLAKRAVGEASVVFVLEHYLEHRDRIEQPFAYYRPGTPTFDAMLMQWSAQQEIDAAQREKELTELWLAGRE